MRGTQARKNKRAGCAVTRLNAAAAAFSHTEILESRVLLSVSHALRIPPHIFRPHHVPVAHNAHRLHSQNHTRPLARTSIQLVSTHNGASPNTGGSSPNPNSFTPANIRHAYGIDNINFGGTAGDGTGQTIAIVDAYDEPGLVSSTDPNFLTSDLAQFDAQFGLPNPPSFLKLDQTGGTSYPDSGKNHGSWAIEEALDVEWAHAVAPKANIILVEATDSNLNNLLGDPNLVINGAVGFARTITGVSIISMSWGANEFSGETSYDSFLTTPAGHTNVSFFASTGDTGSPGEYPAYSPKVVAVGGTMLTLSGGNYSSETAWSGSGGGISTVETKPSYQSAITTVHTSPTASVFATGRVIPDLALDASSPGGVAIYDSVDGGAATPWLGVNGTSFSAPAVAGLIAIADQGRSLAGLGTLKGFTQTLPSIYTLPSSDFHDITSGNNAGFYAVPGFDAVTGFGTPIANTFVPDIAGGATVTGKIFQDNNANNIFDGSDTPLTSLSVYLDLNNNGVQDTGEPTTTTNASGNYTFLDQVGGKTETVRPVTLTGFVQVPSTGVTTSYNTISTGNFGFFPTVYNDAGNADTYTLQISPSDSSQLQILVNGTLSYSAPVTLPGSLGFNFTGSNDVLAIDGANGNPLPSGGVTFNGTSTGNNNAVKVLGSSGNDTFVVASGSMTFGSNPILFSNAANLSIDPRGGADALTVNAGIVNLPAQTGSGFLTRTFSNLTVASGASLRVATAASLHSNRTLILATNIFSIAGTLDLGGNDMVVQNGTLTTITNELASGFAGGNWNGTGINSSAAASDPKFLTALGVMRNTSDGTHTIYSTFDNYTANPNDILVKYTFYGDADLSGSVNGGDYVQIDVTFNSQSGLTGWVNGNFNYDSAVDGSDYTLIDNEFNQQSTGM